MKLRLWAIFATLSLLATFLVIPAGSLAAGPSLAPTGFAPRSSSSGPSLSLAQMLADVGQNPEMGPSPDFHWPSLIHSVDLLLLGAGTAALCAASGTATAATLGLGAPLLLLCVGAAVAFGAAFYAWTEGGTYGGVPASLDAAKNLSALLGSLYNITVSGFRTDTTTILSLLNTSFAYFGELGEAAALQQLPNSTWNPSLDLVKSGVAADIGGIMEDSDLTLSSLFALYSNLFDEKLGTDNPSGSACSASVNGTGGNLAFPEVNNVSAAGCGAVSSLQYFSGATVMNQWVLLPSCAATSRAYLYYAPADGGFLVGYAGGIELEPLGGSSYTTFSADVNHFVNTSSEATSTQWYFACSEGNNESSTQSAIFYPELGFTATPKALSPTTGISATNESGLCAVSGGFIANKTTYGDRYCDGGPASGGVNQSEFFLVPFGNSSATYANGPTALWSSGDPSGPLFTYPTFATNLNVKIEGGSLITAMPTAVRNTEYAVSNTSEAYWSYLRGLGYTTEASVPASCVIPAPSQVLPPTLLPSTLMNLNYTTIENLYESIINAIATSYGASGNVTYTGCASGTPNVALSNTYNPILSPVDPLGVYGEGYMVLSPPKTSAAESGGLPSECPVTSWLPAYITTPQKWCGIGESKSVSGIFFMAPTTASAPTRVGDVFEFGTAPDNVWFQPFFDATSSHAFYAWLGPSSCANVTLPHNGCNTTTQTSYYWPVDGNSTFSGGSVYNTSNGSLTATSGDALYVTACFSANGAVNNSSGNPTNASKWVKTTTAGALCDFKNGSITTNPWNITCHGIIAANCGRSGGGGGGVLTGGSCGVLSFAANALSTALSKIPYVGSVLAGLACLIVEIVVVLVIVFAAIAVIRRIGRGEE